MSTRRGFFATLAALWAANWLPWRRGSKETAWTIGTHVVVTVIPGDTTMSEWEADLDNPAKYQPGDTALAITQTEGTRSDDA